MLQERTEEILLAVDRLLSVHDEWEKDETAPVQPTANFEAAINEAVAAGESGDVPAQCRDLCTALGRLGVEWDAYVAGKRTPDHRPIGSFWGAMRDVIHARNGATADQVKQPEPVYLLIEQKVPHHQIAHHIWGHRGKGPFVTAIGQVDSMKILEESKEPGKHTKGWVHPEQLARQSDGRRELSRRLGAATRREQRDTRPVEKATVVEMLKEGQYPDVIARVKSLSLETVLAEAERYSITPSVRPNLAAERSPQEPPIFGSESAADDSPLADLPAIEDEFGGVEIKQDGESANVSDQDLIRSLNDGKRGVSEIIATAKESGRNFTFKQVKAALAVAKAS